MSPNLRQRAVVSSFIYTDPNSLHGLTFALFKRSQAVRTYPGKWAVCSGSIDPTDFNPEAAAKREIREETRLSDSEFTLFRPGKPFSLIDDALQTQWTIHPFAWKLKDGAKPIELDWEHTEYKFIKPEELKHHDHVPQLEVGLERTMVSSETEAALAVLRDDHESGAQALALKSLQLLLQCAKGDELASLNTASEFWTKLRWRAWHLAKNGRPSMGAAIESALFRALEDAKAEIMTASDGSFTKISLPETKRIVESAILRKISAKNTEDLASHFVQFVENSERIFANKGTPTSVKIVTLSSSGSITKCLVDLVKSFWKNGQNIKLCVLESRPNFEGVSFIDNLFHSLQNDSKFSSTMKIEIFPDAAMAIAVQDSDYFIFGADRVTRNGDVSNKVGTLPAVLAVKSLNATCKVVAIFGTDKITSSRIDSENAENEYNNPEEVMDAWPANCIRQLQDHHATGFQVEVKNPYFEWVPAKYIDQYISERGSLGEGDIQRLGSQNKELEETLFGDL